jgi:putative peptide zinc metalloprotease protein
MAFVVTGVVLAGMHWSELTENIIDRALTPANLMLLWFVYPVVKALHELGHGYAIKKNGGEVHEIGIMLLVLVPVPYVDASAASGFREKRHRMLVGGAGILTELFLGAIAMLVWVNVQPGPAHAVAYNVLLITGVSTLLFNGNPLLRFDGYYVLADLLEIPNLGTRSNKYLGYVIQKHLFGITDAESPANTDGERFWFVVYGIASFIYRIFIMFAIILYIGGKFFAIGVLLAIWSVTTMVVVPVVKHSSFLFTSPKLRRKRTRSIGATVAVLGVIILFLFALPAPLWTRAQGVTWPSENSQVRAGADGFIETVLVAPGEPVAAGQPLIQASDPLLAARVELLEANKKELESQLLAASALDRVQTEIIREALVAADAALEVAKEKTRELTILSPREGTFVIPQAQDLPGRFIRKGQLLAYVVQETDPVTLRVVVSQDEIGRVREEVRRVDVLPAAWGADSYEAQMLRAVPGGTTRLPTAALGIAGGGRFAVDPRDREGRATMERVFELEVALPEEVHSDYLGRRMYVRFDHGWQPVGVQMYVALRQLFLRRFGVELRHAPARRRDRPLSAEAGRARHAARPHGRPDHRRLPAARGQPGRRAPEVRRGGGETRRRPRQSLRWRAQDAHQRASAEALQRGPEGRFRGGVFRPGQGGRHPQAPHAPLRRPAVRRTGHARGHGGRDGDGGGQDHDRHPPRGHGGAGRHSGACRDGQRLPSQPGRPLDGADLQGLRPEGGDHHRGHGSGGAARRLCV